MICNTIRPQRYLNYKRLLYDITWVLQTVGEKYIQKESRPLHLWQSVDSIVIDGQKSTQL